VCRPSSLELNIVNPKSKLQASYLQGAVNDLTVTAQFNLNLGVAVKTAVSSWASADRNFESVWSSKPDEQGDGWKVVDGKGGIFPGITMATLWVTVNKGWISEKLREELVAYNVDQFDRYWVVYLVSGAACVGSVISYCLANYEKKLGSTTQYTTMGGQELSAL